MPVRIGEDVVEGAHELCVAMREAAEFVRVQEWKFQVVAAGQVLLELVGGEYGSFEPDAWCSILDPRSSVRSERSGGHEAVQA